MSTFPSYNILEELEPVWLNVEFPLVESKGPFGGGGGGACVCGRDVCVGGMGCVCGWGGVAGVCVAA